MKCIKAQDLFSVYLENAMEPPLRVVFEQHLAECPQCRADFEKFNATVMMLEELPEVETPSGFHAAVMSRVQEQRQVMPRKVRWWNLDWQKVFTIRVPARAAAMGFAVLLLMVLMFQLTPASTIVADWFGVPRVVNNTVGNDEVDAPKLTKPGNNIASTLSMKVKPGEDGAYELQLTANKTEPIKFSISLISDDEQSRSTYQTGFVRRGEPSKANIRADEALGVQVVEVIWRNNDSVCTNYAFLPSKFDAQASAKTMQFTVNDLSVFDVLKKISSSYGVVILASGNMGREIDYAGVESGRPEDALYACVKQAGMTWQAVDSSIYTVEPGD